MITLNFSYSLITMQYILYKTLLKILRNEFNFYFNEIDLLF